MNTNLKATTARVTTAVEALVQHTGQSCTINILAQQLIGIIDSLPKTKQKAAIESFRSVVGNHVRIERTNILSGQKVFIRFDNVGTVCDPQMELYHTC